LTITCDILQRSSVGARRYCQLCCPTTVEYVTPWAPGFVELSRNTFRRLPCRFHWNFLSPEFFGRSSRGKYLYFWRYRSSILHAHIYVVRCLCRSSCLPTSIQISCSTKGRRDPPDRRERRARSDYLAIPCIYLPDPMCPRRVRSTAIAL